MALKLKYTDEHGILHIDMSPSATPRVEADQKDITDPKFDTINNRFGQYDLFGGKYDVDSGEDTPRSLFRSRYNSVEEELANTPYAFASERSLRLRTAHSPLLDISIDARADASPSKDILDDRFFNRKLDYDLFGPQIDYSSKSSVKDDDTFTVTQLIHAQDRYYDLSARSVTSDDIKTDKTQFKNTDTKNPKNRVQHIRDSFEVRSAPGSAKRGRAVRIENRVKTGSVQSGQDEAFRVLSVSPVKAAEASSATTVPVVPTSKRKRELSFAILTEAVSSRPTSPRSLPADVRADRVSPFKGRGFREETSRHTTPRTSAANSRASSPPRRRTSSLSKIDKMAQTATLPISIHTLNRPHSPRNFVRQNIEDIREISELNRERHEAAAEKKRRAEEDAILKEMGLLEKKESGKSVSVSRTSSRSNSPNKMTLRSRSNSPAAILHFENITTSSKDLINVESGVVKPTTHNSRVRSTSKSQPQSNNGSPKKSQIPKRQASVSPPRTVTRRSVSYTRKNTEGGLNSNRFISNSTSSIHETIKIGSQVHDKRFSKSTQNLSISPSHIKGKPPISPGRSGPPPSNKTINPKRLSPIVGTPNKSPVEDLKPSPKTTTKPSTATKKPVKTNTTPATSRIISRPPGKGVSRDPSPDKRKAVSKAPATKPITKPVQSKVNQNKPVARTQSTRTTTKPVPPNQRPPIKSKSEIKKPINRTNSMKSLTRIPSSKNLTEKPPLKRKDSQINLKEKAQSTSKINEIGLRKIDEKKITKPVPKSAVKKEESQKKKEEPKKEKPITVDSATDGEQILKQDNETQYDKITNEKGELVILTKKNIISMTTAAITAQPLEVVTKVTNQLPAAFEKARERGVFERHGSKDSLAPKENEKGHNDNLSRNEIKEVKNEVEDKIEIVDIKTKDNAPEEAIKIEVAQNKHRTDQKESNETKEHADDGEKLEDKKHPKHKNHETKTLFIEDNFKLRPLQPPYNNPEVEKVRQKIDNILRSPEISPTNILAPIIKETTNPFKAFANKAKNDAKKAKNDAANKLVEVKDELVKQNEKANAEIRKEATKIVDSIITPVEQPVEIKPKKELKSIIEPVITVVNEKKTNGLKELEKMTETLVKGDPETEVQSSNLSTPGLEVKKKGEGNASENSTHSNGGFPQSTSTTPKPPPRNKSTAKEDNPDTNKSESEEIDKPKKPNMCQRIIGKCKSRCCGCCVKRSDGESETQEAKMEEGKGGVMSKLNCFKKDVKDVEKAVEKTSLEFETETKVQRKRTLRDVACCGRGRRVSDATDTRPRQESDAAETGPRRDSDAAPAGCCGKKGRPQRRDSILSDTPDTRCCNNRLGAWFRRGPSSSRRTSMFSKNKSLSPTLPPEDTRPRLDTSLIEHTSIIRGAIPVLPAPLAYFCLLCNIIVPGLGTIFSGIFCLCFGIPRFGVHDGARQRIGSFVINLLVGCGQLFTVLFCLVGWGWSIWWGVIMVRTSRKYRKLKAEAVVEEAEAPPVTANNHTQA